MVNDQAANRSISGGQWARSVFIPLLPALAISLGGATEKWAEGIALALLGAFLLFQPPRRSLGLAVNVLFILLACSALICFLPNSWFFTPAWRTAIIDQAHIALSNTITPQPWVSLGCYLSFVAGLCWLYRVAAQQLELRTARFQLRLNAVAITVIAALSLLLYATGQRLPFWDNAFGPLPTRSTTADLLAMTGVVILASGQDAIRYARKTWVLWLVAFGAIVGAAFVNSSRTGIAVLLATSGIWSLVIALRVGLSSRGTRVVVGVTIGAAVGLLSLALWRIARAELPGLFSSTRIWQVTATTRWPGIGLGNLDSLFPVLAAGLRENGFNQLFKNDWVWTTAELGFVPVALITALAMMLLWRVFPLEAGSNQRFRLAALLGAFVFALHGITSTSAHQTGTAYSGLFLLGLALHRPSRVQVVTSKVTVWTFRIVGVALLVTGVLWTVAPRTMALLPGSVGVANAKRLASFAANGRNYSEAVELTTHALEWAPLDWELYNLRANAEIALKSPQNAIEDFRRARFLRGTRTLAELAHERSLGGSQPGDGNPEWATTHIIETNAMTEFH